MHEIPCSIFNIMRICFFVFPSMYQYIPVQTKYIFSTYQVQAKNIVVHTAKKIGILSKLSWKNVGTVLYWCVLFCIGSYYAIVSYHLVLLCSCTYPFVNRFTILRILTFWFGTRYIQICTEQIAVQIWMYREPKWICRNPQDREQHYKKVQGGMYRYRAEQDGMVL